MRIYGTLTGTPMRAESQVCESATNGLISMFRVLQQLNLVHRYKNAGHILAENLGSYLK